MARPKTGIKCRKLSISVNKRVADLAEQAKGTSHFFQTSAECMDALTKVFAACQREGLSPSHALEHIGTIVKVWEAEFNSPSLSPLDELLNSITKNKTSIRPRK